MTTLDITQDANLTTLSSLAVTDLLFAESGGALKDFPFGLLLRAFAPGGRLTLTSGTPVTSSDVTGATTVYYTPYLHNLICLWDGTYWVPTVFSETSLAIGTVTSGLPYDVFGYLSSVSLTLEKLAWTNGTTRATAISLQDGRYCKSGDKTRLYLGSVYTTSTTTTEDSGGGSTSQTGGKRFLWNMYTRVDRHLAVIDTTDSWSYTTATIRQANNGSGNKVEFFVGLADNAISADLICTVYTKNQNDSSSAMVGIGVDSTTAFSGHRSAAFITTPAMNAPLSGAYRGIPSAGYHYLAWCEKGCTDTCIFTGDNAADGRQSGLYATVRA